MIIPACEKAVDFYPRFAAMLRYLAKLPDDEDVRLACSRSDRQDGNTFDQRSLNNL